MLGMAGLLAKPRWTWQRNTAGNFRATLPTYGLLLEKWCFNQTLITKRIIRCNVLKMSYMSWVLCFEYVVTNCVSYPLSFSVLFLCLKIKDIKYFNLNTRVQSLFFLCIWALQHLFLKKYENTKVINSFPTRNTQKTTRQRHSDFTTTTFHVSFPYLRNTPRLREVFVVLLGGSETQASTDRQLRYDIAR